MIVFSTRNPLQEGLFLKMLWKDLLQGFFLSDTLPDIVLLEWSHVCFSLTESPLQFWQKQEGPKGNHGSSHADPRSWQHASIETGLQRPLLPDRSDPGNLSKQFLGLNLLNKYKVHFGLKGSQKCSSQGLPHQELLSLRNTENCLSILSYISK